jgi:hypothetical protein
MIFLHGWFVVSLQLVWKLAGNKRNMELKKKVVKEIASENNTQVDFSDFPEMVEHNGSDKVPHQSNQEAILGSRNRR